MSDPTRTGILIRDTDGKRVDLDSLTMVTAELAAAAKAVAEASERAKTATITYELAWKAKDLAVRELQAARHRMAIARGDVEAVERMGIVKEPFKSLPLPEPIDKAFER